MPGLGAPSRGKAGRPLFPLARPAKPLIFKVWSFLGAPKRAKKKASKNDYFLRRTNNIVYFIKNVKLFLISLNKIFPFL